MTPAYLHLTGTRLLDFDSPSISKLIKERAWKELAHEGRIGAAYDFVRNEIAFGYNRADEISASEVLAGGYGQCNTKGTLLMALLRGLGIRCRLHGFTIHKALQRGVVPEFIYPLAPAEILHSWCRVALNWALPQSVWRNGSILARNNSGPARPYMARLSVFRRLI